MRVHNLILVFLALTFSMDFYSASWWDDEHYMHDIGVKSIQFLYQEKLRNRVLFIDTREKEEFNEGHIPGAIHLRLVDIDKADLSRLKDYDFVVPYCLKDFRGYEVARKLKSIGFDNVFMMTPSGLRGWQKSGKILEYNQI